MLITTVEIHTTENGESVLVYHGQVSSIAAALRVVDKNAPAPVCPSVRRRVRAERGGRFRIGSIRAVIGVYA
jgi:hypothetical protein